MPTRRRTRLTSSRCSRQSPAWSCESTPSASLPKSEGRIRSKPSLMCSSMTPTHSSATKQLSPSAEKLELRESRIRKDFEVSPLRAMPENPTFHDVDDVESPPRFQYPPYLRKSSLQALEVMERIHGEYQVEALRIDLVHLLGLLLEEPYVGESSLTTSALDHLDSTRVRFDRVDKSAFPDEFGCSDGEESSPSTDVCDLQAARGSYLPHPLEGVLEDAPDLFSECIHQSSSSVAGPVRSLAIPPKTSPTMNPPIWAPYATPVLIPAKE